MHVKAAILGSLDISQETLQQRFQEEWYLQGAKKLLEMAQISVEDRNPDGKDDFIGTGHPDTTTWGKRLAP